MKASINSLSSGHRLKLDQAHSAAVRIQRVKIILTLAYIKFKDTLKVELKRKKKPTRFLFTIVTFQQYLKMLQKVISVFFFNQYGISQL